MRVTRHLREAALNAATLARNAAGDGSIGLRVGLSSDDLRRARQALEGMPQDCMTTAFDRRDYLITAGWRPTKP